MRAGFAGTFDIGAHGLGRVDDEDQAGGGSRVRGRCPGVAAAGFAAGGGLRFDRTRGGRRRKAGARA
jgi:hypothetical protein